jgi:hypothetical protein
MKARRMRRAVVDHWGRGEVGSGKRGVNRWDDDRIDGGGDGNGNNGKQCQRICLALPRARRQ